MVLHAVIQDSPAMFSDNMHTCMNMYGWSENKAASIIIRNTCSIFFPCEIHLIPMNSAAFFPGQVPCFSSPEQRRAPGRGLPLQGFPNDSRRCSQVEAQSSGSWGSPAGTRMYHRRPGWAVIWWMLIFLGWNLRIFFRDFQ